MDPRAPDPLETAPRRTLALIYNPTAGRGRAEALARRLTRELHRRNADVVPMPTGRAGDARCFARERAHDFDALVALGGDGTAAEVLDGAIENARHRNDGRLPTPVAVAPAGTANVLARAWGLAGRWTGRVRWARVADAIVYGPARPLDAVWAASAPENVADGAAASTSPDGAADGPPRGGRPFFLCAGCGVDAEIVHAVHAGRRGAIRMGRYLRPALRALGGRPWPRVDVTVDGRPFARDAALVVIGNVNRYGGFFRFFGGDARDDDGVFDVIALRPRRRRDWLRFAWRALRGRWPEDEPRVRVTRGRVATVRAADPAPDADAASSPETESSGRSGAIAIQYDGDPGGWTPATFTLQPGVARIVVPASPSSPRKG